MRNLSIILLLLAVISCKTSQKATTTEGYNASDYAIFERDSVKYVFDRIDAQQRYAYYIQYLPTKKIGKFQIFQGDIVINSNIKSAPGIDSLIINKEVVQPYKMIGVEPLSEDRLWPNAYVRYTISPNGDAQELGSSIHQAISAWESVGIVFEELPYASGDCIVFEVDPEYPYNFSPVGHQGREQTINLRSDVSTGSIIHEIGHSLGLWHEHCRPDRNKYVSILIDNIDPSSTKEFDPIGESFSYYMTSYDYNSIMHYDAYAFGKKGPDGKTLMTIRTKPAGKTIGQRASPSNSDIKGIKLMYHLK